MRTPFFRLILPTPEDCPPAVLKFPLKSTRINTGSEDVEAVPEQQGRAYRRTLRTGEGGEMLGGPDKDKQPHLGVGNL